MARHADSGGLKDSQLAIGLSPMQLRVAVQRRKRLSVQEVTSIKQRLSEEGDLESIAREFSVSDSTINRISTGKIWKNVDSIKYPPKESWARKRAVIKESKWNNPISDSEKAEITSNYVEHQMSIDDVASSLSRSATTVRRVLTNSKVTIRSQSETKNIKGSTAAQIASRQKPKSEETKAKLSATHKGRKCPWASFKCTEPDREDVLYLIVYCKRDKTYLKIGRSYQGASYHIRQTNKKTVVSVEKAWTGRSAWVWEVERAVLLNFSQFLTKDRFKHSSECFEFETLNAQSVTNFVEQDYEAKEKR